jgi:hypothetical protein
MFSLHNVIKRKKEEEDGSGLPPPIMMTTFEPGASWAAGSVESQLPSTSESETYLANQNLDNLGTPTEPNIPGAAAIIQEKNVGVSSLLSVIFLLIWCECQTELRSELTQLRDHATSQTEEMNRMLEHSAKQENELSFLREQATRQEDLIAEMHGQAEHQQHEQQIMLQVWI